MSFNIKKGDKVTVLTGKSKGESGKVISVLTADKRVVVEGVNLVTEHNKPRKSTEQGGIITKEAPLDVSNVMLICPKCNKPCRTGVKTNFVDGKKVKVRICKKCGAEIATPDSTK